MPAAVQRARWETSQRPLFIKTVWRNGLRHAILSRDDPLCSKPEQRRESSTSSVLARFLPPPVAPPPPPARPSELERCLMKLQLVLASSEPSRHNVVLIPTRETRVEQQQVSNEQSEHKLNIESSSDETESDEENDEKETGNVEQYNNNNKNKNNNECDTCEESYEDIPTDPSWLPELNPLSERVLQWLELEAKKSRPRYFDLRTLRRRDATISSNNNIPKTTAPICSVVPRVTNVRRVRRRAVARWSPQHKNQPPPPDPLSVTAHSVPRKPLIKIHPPPPPALQPSNTNPRVTWSGEPSRPQLHIFIPSTEYELSSVSECRTPDSMKS